MHSTKHSVITFLCNSVKSPYFQETKDGLNNLKTRPFFYRC